MRAKTLLILSVAALLLCGCGGREKYGKVDTERTQEDLDYDQCDWEASRSVSAVPKDSDRQDRIEELVDKCMKAKGYRKK